ncbi:MAG: hypothetical protein KBG15_12780 [Kofleriaceae bacterium]|nr:hypothetical protein [Kofleriaceae bacterium]
MLLLAACTQERIEIRSESANDYHRADVRRAVETYVAKGRTAVGYAILASKLSVLRPSMDATVASDAELKLVTLALAPMLAASAVPVERELREVVTNVWPIGLQDPLRADTVQQRTASKDGKLTPLAYEDPQAYLMRLCGDVLKVECYSVVPEYQADVVRHIVLQRFTERVRTAVADCVFCANDSTWRDYVHKWELLEAASVERRRRAERVGDPIRWPTSGPAASPMPASDAYVMVELNAVGELFVGDTRLPVVDRVARLQQLRGDRDVLIHAAPSARLSDLRPVIVDVTRAGATRVGVVSRRREYPWAPGVYWITVGEGVVLPLRLGDTVQVLISTLDELPPSTTPAAIK